MSEYFLKDLYEGNKYVNFGVRYLRDNKHNDLIIV